MAKPLPPDAKGRGLFSSFTWATWIKLDVIWIADCISAWLPFPADQRNISSQIAISHFQAKVTHRHINEL